MTFEHPSLQLLSRLWFDLLFLVSDGDFQERSLLLLGSDGSVYSANLSSWNICWGNKTISCLSGCLSDKRLWLWDFVSICDKCFISRFTVEFFKINKCRLLWIFLDFFFLLGRKKTEIVYWLLCIVMDILQTSGND